jgi:hypothetical protein
VGPRAPNGGREIDALLVDGGINDLHFSTIIRACASSNNHRLGHTDCVTGFAASKLVNKPQFAARYDALAAAIRRLNVRETYLNGYPSQVFRGGGCGKVGFPLIGIDRAEGEAMNTLGIALNGRVEQAVLRHLADGWNLIEDLTGPFEPHAYQGLLVSLGQHEIGWLAWSWWKDNCPSRQMSSTGAYAGLTTYGNDLVNNASYGLRQGTFHASRTPTLP